MGREVFPWTEDSCPSSERECSRGHSNWQELPSWEHTHTAQPENHRIHSPPLSKFRPWIRRPRPGDCQRWQGLPGSIQGSQWGHFRWIGSLLGAGMVLSFAGHSPSGPPGTHGQQHHYKPSCSAALPNPSPPGEGPWPLLRNLSEPVRPTVLKGWFGFCRPPHLHSKLCLFTTTGNSLTVQCGRVFKHSQKEAEEERKDCWAEGGVGVPVSL